jgi:hypothetical protein
MRLGPHPQALSLGGFAPRSGRRRFPQFPSSPVHFVRSRRSSRRSRTSSRLSRRSSRRSRRSSRRSRMSSNRSRRPPSCLASRRSSRRSRESSRRSRTPSRRSRRSSRRSRMSSNRSRICPRWRWAASTDAGTRSDTNRRTPTAVYMCRIVITLRRRLILRPPSAGRVKTVASGGKNRGFRLQPEDFRLKAEATWESS